MSEEAKEGVKREAVGWAKTVIFAVILALFINHVVIVNAVVPSGSMETTITAPSRIVADRLAYLFSNPKRFDVVVFWFPDDPTQRFVKRVIGLPGETVNIRDGKVYITSPDGTEDPVPLDDSFAQGSGGNPSGDYAGPPAGDWGPFTVPAGCYFMMGDNRNISFDSRKWDEPYVAKSAIIGKAVLEYFPHVKSLLRH